MYERIQIRREPGRCKMQMDKNPECIQEYTRGSVCKEALARCGGMWAAHLNKPFKLFFNSSCSLALASSLAFSFFSSSFCLATSTSSAP